MSWEDDAPDVETSHSWGKEIQGSSRLSQLVKKYDERKSLVWPDVDLELLIILKSNKKSFEI